MINAKLLWDKGILVVTPVDKLETADFEQLSELVDPYIEEHGGLNGLLIEVESFPRWQDFASMLSHIRFLSEYEKKIERVAAVTDDQFLAILPKLADYFSAAEVRYFDYRERDKALFWLRSGISMP